MYLKTFLKEIIVYISLIYFVRFFQLYRVGHFYTLTEIRTSLPTLFRLFKLVFLCFIIFHWNGCLYYFISISHGYMSQSQQIERLGRGFCNIIYNLLRFCFRLFDRRLGLYLQQNSGSPPRSMRYFPVGTEVPCEYKYYVLNLH